MRETDREKMVQMLQTSNEQQSSKHLHGQPLVYLMNQSRQKGCLAELILWKAEGLQQPQDRADLFKTLFVKRKLSLVLSSLYAF